MKTKKMKKLFLCKEGTELFYLDAPNMETAKEDVIIWNAVVIKEVPRSYEKVNPSHALHQVL